MTVYNVTKLIDFKTINTIKRYLNVDKLTLRYSDLLNDFELYTKETHNQKKKRRCTKYLIKKYDLMNYKIDTLTIYPIIKRK